LFGGCTHLAVYRLNIGLMWKLKDVNAILNVEEMVLNKRL